MKRFICITSEKSAQSHYSTVTFKVRQPGAFCPPCSTLRAGRWDRPQHRRHSRLASLDQRGGQIHRGGFHYGQVTVHWCWLCWWWCLPVSIFFVNSQIDLSWCWWLTAGCRWIFFGSPYNNYLARIPKRLRYASHQKTSAGVKFVQNIFRNLCKLFPSKFCELKVVLTESLSIFV